ncbi:hypothetical protein [Bryobacter aggregatus]|uniref:hypothetical protein n=1 Tax=Bryobacter aggregatus TaxID=360054 RepID=UPI0012BA76D4|nr:hypothetical protein [Bryobacter aggregatus]
MKTKITFATTILAMSALFAQSTPPATNQAPTKAERSKSGKHKKHKKDAATTPPAR